MLVRQGWGGKGQLEIYEVPDGLGGDTGPPIATDNDIGPNVMDIAGGKYEGNEGDQLVVMWAPRYRTIQELVVYDVPTEVDGDTGPAIASDTYIGTTDQYMTVGNFDGDSDVELAVARYVQAEDRYHLSIHDMPTSVGGDIGPPIASDDNIWKNIIAMAAANYDHDSEDELVVVRRKASGGHKLLIYDVPTEVGGNTGPPIASDKSFGKHIIPCGVATGNFDNDPEPELAVVRTDPASGSHKLEIYDAPTEVGANTGPPIARDDNIGKNITTIGACEFVNPW